MNPYESKFTETTGTLVRENDVLKDKITKLQKSMDTMYYEMVEILADAQETNAAEFLETMMKEYRDMSLDLRRVLADIKLDLN